MKGKRRTPLPRPPVRKRKKGTKPAPPRPKGHDERLAVRRCAAMKYRLAGASYRAIAEKLTDERASEYADANGISVERAMKKIPHVSTRTAWDDVLAEFEGLRRETEVQRSDLMALENALLGPVRRDWSDSGWRPAGYALGQHAGGREPHVHTASRRRVSRRVVRVLTITRPASESPIGRGHLSAR